MANLPNIRGLDELKRRMDEFPKKLQRRALGKGVRAAAVFVRNAARANAPEKTGALKRNIQVKKVRYPDGVRYIIGVEHGKIVKAADGRVVRGSKRRGFRIVKANRRESAGEDPFYYRFQERGFTAVGRRRGGQGRKIPGKHFLKNALTHNASLLVDLMRDQIAITLDKF